MRRTYALRILALAFVLFIGACDIDSELECRVGTQGVSATFSPDTWRQAFDQEIEHPLVIDINNRGAYTADMIISLQTARDYIAVTPTNKELSIEGKERWNECRGTQERVQFTIEPYRIPIVFQEIETDMAISACYRYHNEASAVICVDPEIGATTAVGKNCRMADKRIGGGQGSPLSVVRVEAPVVRPGDGAHTVDLRIYVRNHGDGEIIAHPQPDDLELACSADPEVERNFIWVRGYLDNHLLDCRFREDDHGIEGKTRLRADPDVRIERDERIVLRDYYFDCRADEVALRGEVEMNLQLEMSYFYKESHADQRRVSVRKR